MNEEHYLSKWNEILYDRAEQVVERFKRIEGVQSLILAGSLGGGKPWPLSDIDIIPIYEDDLSQQANEQVKQARVELMDGWIRDGWRTALDVGTLYFANREVDKIVHSDTDDMDNLLTNPSLYHCLDKGYQGKAVFDPQGRGAPLTDWFKDKRFDNHVIAIRKQHLKERYRVASAQIVTHMQQNSYIEATYELNAAVEILRTYLLESWKERDHSFARIGTRFEKLAEGKGLTEIVHVLNELKTLDDEAVLRRISSSPQWIKDRHDLSYTCRVMIGEKVTKIQDARDVLRVFSRYEMQKFFNATPRHSEWLGIITDANALQSKYHLLMDTGRNIME